MMITDSPFFYAKYYARDRPSYNALSSPLYIDRHLALPSKCEASHFDGWGEGFEQHSIDADGNEMYVSFWHPGDDYFIYDQEEFDIHLESGHSMGGIE